MGHQDNPSGYPGYRSIVKTLGLPTFRISYDNGESYVTSMAYGITLDQARAYFPIGHVVERWDDRQGHEKRTITGVDWEK